MKRLSAALITFIIGTAAFNALEMKSAGSLQPAPESRVAEVSKTPVVLISYENVPDRVRKPFFDSFGKDDTERDFGGWFIADDFKGMPEVWTIFFARINDSKDSEPHWLATVLTQNADDSPNDDDFFIRFR